VKRHARRGMAKYCERAGERVETQQDPGLERLRKSIRAGETRAYGAYGRRASARGGQSTRSRSQDAHTDPPLRGAGHPRLLGRGEAQEPSGDALEFAPSTDVARRLIG